MDVRCDRCQTEYELDEGRLTDAGVAVKCTNCGNVFKVRRVSSPPGVAAPHVLGEPHAPTAAPVLGVPARVWLVRRYDGSTLTLNDLTELQRAVVERQVAPDDGVSISGGAWHTLGSIPELASFFEVVRISNRTTSGSFPHTGVAGSGSRTTTASMLAAQGRTLTPVWEEGPSSLGNLGAHKADPAWTSAAPPADPELDALLEKEDTRFLQKSRMGRWIGLLVALLFVGGAIAFYGLGLPGMTAPGTLSVVPIKPPDVNALGRPALSPETTPGAPPATLEALAPPPPAAPAAAQAPQAPKAEAVPAASPTAPRIEAKPETPAGKAEPSSTVAKKVAAASEAAEGSAPAGRGFDYYIGQGHKLLDSKPSTALALFEKAAELDPKSPEPDSGRGLAYSNMERLTDAATAFQVALRKSSEFTEAILGLAEVSAQQGNRRKAIGLYQRYLDLTPDGPDAPAARAQLDELKAEAPAQPAAEKTIAPPVAAPAPAAVKPSEAASPPSSSAEPKRVDVPPPPPVVVPDTAPSAQ
jgi:predicted Zn finger-like uncharacterized protein